MLVNGREIVRTILEKPTEVNEGETAPTKYYNLQVRTVDDQGGTCTELDLLFPKPIYLQAWIEALSRQCDDQYNRVAESDVWIRATCNRYAEKTLRIATLLAVADNALGSPQVGLHHLQWAQSFVGAHNQLILNAARRGAFGGSGDDARGVSVLSGFLADYLKGMVPVPPSVQRPEEAEAMRSQGCVSYSVLYKRLCHKAPFHNHRRGVKQGIQSCLDIMVDRGLLAIMPSPTALSMFNTTAKVYIVKGFDND